MSKMETYLRELALKTGYNATKKVWGNKNHRTQWELSHPDGRVCANGERLTTREAYFILLTVYDQLNP